MPITFPYDPSDPPPPPPPPPPAACQSKGGGKKPKDQKPDHQPEDQKPEDAKPEDQQPDDADDAGKAEGKDADRSPPPPPPEATGLDPTEAPEGYRAAPATDGCYGCAFNGGTCPVVSCMGGQRKDRQTVIFIEGRA